MEFVVDLGRRIVHVQGDRRHSQIRLLVNTNRKKAIWELICQSRPVSGIGKTRCLPKTRQLSCTTRLLSSSHIFRDLLSLLTVALTLDLVGTLFIWEVFFDSCLNDLLNRLVILICFKLADYSSCVNNRLQFEFIFVDQGELCGIIVVDHVCVIVAFIHLKDG